VGIVSDAVFTSTARLAGNYARPKIKWELSVAEFLLAAGDIFKTTAPASKTWSVV
jgi:hypothetical protein